MKTNKTNKNFKIQGEFSEDDNCFLYWSNDDGWVDFKSATIFNANEKINLPIGTTKIVEIP